MINAGLMSSATPEHYTPACVLDRVRQLGPIGLDPCAAEDAIVGAACEYRLDRGEDGLRLSWFGHGFVFVNPPYGRAIGSWVSACATYGECGVELVALLPARTDTDWWQTYVTTVQAICFWRGRLRFSGAGPAPFPSAVVYWGDRARAFERAFGDVGFVVCP